MSEPSTPGQLSTAQNILLKVVKWPVQVLLSGLIIILPFVILGLLFGMALDFIRSLLQPIIAILRWGGIIRMANFGFIGRTLIKLGFYEDVFGFFVEFLAVLVLLTTIIVLGIFVSFQSGKRIIEFIDYLIISIPGVGPVYKSFRRMGDVVLESGLDKFRSVKLVEFPNEGNFALAFETNRAPDSIKSATERDNMVTLFVPLAPNPVMGGFLIHVSRDQVLDIDMSVEEAARSLITSGIAAGESRKPSPNPLHRVKNMTDMDEIVKKPEIDSVWGSTEDKDRHPDDKK